MPPQPLTLVEGKYEVLAKIREGGMGTIYKVRHRLLDEIRVIKVIRPNVAADEEFKRRFIDEAKTATRLKHPNICAIYDFALDPDGSSSLVMEFIDGVTLSDLLRAQQSLDIALALEITHQTLLALGYLHKKKIVHRDIAPDNLMLTVDDEGKSVVKLIDLGIAKNLDKGGEMTSTGQFLGKLRYASPEQYGALAKGSQIDGRSDLYSMGLVLYELVTGRRPFSGETPIELMRAHVYEEPLPFELSDPKRLVSEEIRQIVFKAIRKNRDQRFASAQEFDYAVAGALAHVDRQFAEDEGPTLIMGAKAKARSHEPSPTPSAQDRLNFQFADQRTPTHSATTPMPPLELVERTEAVRLRQQQELQQIRDAEEKRDRAALQRMLDAGTFSSASAAELRNALERVAQRVAAEAIQKEATEWEAATKDGTVEGWERYLSAQPNSTRLAEARRLRDEAVRKRDARALEAARRAGTADALRAFLAAHAGSALEATAKALLAEQEGFDSAAAHDTEGAWRGFLERWPSAALATAASERLKAALNREELAWKAANDDGTAGALLQFLNVFPSGKHHHEAEGLLRELAELDAAGKEGLPGYQRFLHKHPSNRHARTVRHKIRELEEKALLSQIEGFQANLQEDELEKLLLTYPPGSTVVGTAAAEALAAARAEKERQRIRIEEADWAQAKAGSREGDWKRFIKKHPDSSHAGEARSGLALAIEAKIRAAEEQAELEQIRQLEWSKAEEDLRGIQAKHAEDSIVGAAAADALERIRAERERQKHEAEEAEWASAAAGGEPEWQRFLAAHPGSRHAGEARRKLAQAAEARRREAEEAAVLAEIREHEDALAEGALDKLARAQPPSATAVKSAATAALARVREQLARRQREAEEQDWASAVGEGTADSWKRYLERYPASERAKQARQRLAKAQKVESAQVKAVQRAEMRAKSAAKRITLDELSPPKSRRGLLIGLAAAAAVIAAAILLWPKPRGTPPRPTESTAVQQAPVAAAPRAEAPKVEPTAPPAAAAVEPGELAFNALPWGRVDRIVDASGKGWDDGLPQYTPSTFRLPPGRYTLTVSNPNYPAGLDVTVEIRSGQVSSEIGRFEAVDAKAYFRSQGWGG